jgi:tetratricopeptide (TPR) repeat protein
MKNKLNNLLSKIGLNETERAMIVRAGIVSTALCVLMVAGFWAFNFFTMERAVGAYDGQTFTMEAGFGAPEIKDIDIEAHEFAARRLMQAGRPDVALPHLQRIAAIRRGEPAAFDALDRMVDAFLEVGEFGRALVAVTTLLQTAVDAPSASLMVRKGIALYNLGEFQESSEILQQILEDDPHNAEALCFMGQMEAATQTRSPTAERFFRRAIEANPDRAETRYQFARYFENNGDYRRAREFLLEILARDPLNVRANARLGMVYYYERNAQMALKSYQTALALNPYDYNTRYNLGELYRTLFEDNEKALREFVLALEHNPNHSEANYRAGLICAQNGMMKEAIRYFEASLQGDRRDIRRLLQLAAAYERIGDKSIALSIYREITDIDPLHSIALHKIRSLSRES